MRGSRFLLIAVCCLALLVPTATATAADSLYWTNLGVPGSISLLAFDGSGGSNFNSAGAPFGAPIGVAINPANGKIYWANNTINSISYANLDGTGGGTLSVDGATLNFPLGVAVNPAANKIYWSNSGGTVGFANLDGSGAGGTLDLTGSGANDPLGIAINPGANKIYLANYTGNTIGFANLDGSGAGGTLNTGGAPVSHPQGIAIDPNSGKIYWSNESFNTIGFANLDDSGSGGTLNTVGTGMDGPTGLAIDPDSNKLYIAGNLNNTLAYADLGGTGGSGVNPAGALLGAPAYVAVLKRPSVEKASVVRPSSGAVGQTLSCSDAQWAENWLGASLYRAPATTARQWLRNGVEISGAKGSSLVADQAGSYSCRLTATNFAGASSSESSAVTVSTAPPPPCPTARVRIAKPSGPKGRTRSIRFVPGVRLVASVNSPAKVTVTARASGQNASGKKVSAPLVGVKNMVVAGGKRRFGLILGSRAKRSFHLGQVLQISYSATPTPLSAGCPAQAASKESLSARVSKIVVAD